MKILVAGNSKHWAIERYFIKYLKKLGAEIIFFGSGDIVHDFHTKNLINKVLFHSKLVTKYPQVNKGLLEYARREKPDFIWVFKGMEIYPETLSTLKKEGFRLANYNPDHPFIITSKGSGNEHVRKSVGLYDVHFCYQHQLQQEIEKRFNIKTVFLPFAFELEDVVYTDPSAISEINKLCFQGNPDSYRVKIIKDVAEQGIPVDVYGHGWDKTSLSGMSNVNCFPIASRAEFWEKNQAYRVQLNLFREYNFGSHNMRSFEIPVVGGVQLTTYSDEQNEFFKEEKEIFFFRKEAEIHEKVKYLLGLHNSVVADIRAAARQRSLLSGYTFQDRAETVYTTFKQLM